MKTYEGLDKQEEIINSRLLKLWQDLYKGAPLPSYWSQIGNSSIPNSQLICFAIDYQKLDLRALAMIINKNFKPGDVILVEGLSQNKTYSAKMNPYTGFVDPNYPIHGWEPQNFNSYIWGAKKEDQDDFAQIVQELKNNLMKIFSNKIRLKI